MWVDKRSGGRAVGVAVVVDQLLEAALQLEELRRVAVLEGRGAHVDVLDESALVGAKDEHPFADEDDNAFAANEAPL